MNASLAQPRTKPAQENPDVTRAKVISRTYDFDERCEKIVASIPSRRDSVVRYVVEGHSHGRDATCSCAGYLRWRRCVHQASFVLIIEELEKQHYAQPEHTTEGLIEFLDYYERIPDVLDCDQRLRRNGIRAALASRGVRYEATRTLAEQRAVAERMAGAKAILFSE